ncbi:MAG: hypothetical protein ACP5QO_09205 [Clostridia bacterium]
MLDTNRETIRRRQDAGAHAFYDLEADPEDLAEFCDCPSRPSLSGGGGRAGALAGYMVFAPASGTPVTPAGVSGFGPASRGDTRVSQGRGRVWQKDASAFGPHGP